MILENIDKQVFAAYNPTYITKTCKLPAPHIYMTDKWMKDLDLNVFDYVKKIIVSRKQFRQKHSREYKTTNLRTLYHLVALMLNRIFGQDNGKFYKTSWIPLILLM